MQLMQLMQCPKSNAAKEGYPKTGGGKKKQAKWAPKQIQYEQNKKEKEDFII